MELNFCSMRYLERITAQEAVDRTVLRVCIARYLFPNKHSSRTNNCFVRVRWLESGYVITPFIMTTVRKHERICKMEGTKLQTERPT